MAEKLRVGMIGCGEIAVQTAKGIAAASRAEHVMMMDVDERVAKDLAGTYGVPYTTRLEELLANPAVDAVYIATPHYLHAPLTLQALQAGKHVLVEKPIATTLADADAMIAAAREKGLVLSVAFTAQVDAACQQVRELIAAGAIGRVTGTRIVCRADKPASYWTGGYSGRIQTTWRPSKAQSGGGILIMNAVHNLNTMRYLTGLDAVRVSAEADTFTTPVEVEDYIAVVYRYANGAIGTLEAGSAIRGRDPQGESDRIYGELGQILLSRPTKVFVTRESAGLKVGEWQELPTPPASGPGGRAAIVDGFAAAVLEGRTPPVRGEDGRAALEIILAAYQSAAEHRVVNLPL
ncbi:MAG: Gfo/Idh/MocA family oxidoreductase [Armatimonadota bacterium]|nr:Gfo/Idh/MocA family oxidoreductase [Armatimonadota bacterium]